MRWRIAASALFLSVVAVAPLVAQDELAGAFTFTPVADGFNRPLLVTNASDGSGRLFVVEQGGRIWVIDENGERAAEPYLDISDRVSPEADGPNYSERGLLGLAFDPNFEENRYFFVDYTDVAGNSVLARFEQSADNPDIADPATAFTILQQEQPYANHNGGMIAFGPDGYLYVGFGDGGSQGDPQGNGQNLNVWLGKILRIDVSSDPEQPYIVPEDNPFVGTESAQPEIWAYGFRNPWRFSFDRETGDLFIGDVGAGYIEEIDYQPADSVGGENYGWVLFEGSDPLTNAEPPADLVMPIAEYTHDVGISVSGGYVYRGEAIPALDGVYLYGDWGTGRLWALTTNGDGTWENQVVQESTGFSISSFGEDEAGELYIADYSGTIYRFDPV